MRRLCVVLSLGHFLAFLALPISGQWLDVVESPITCDEPGNNCKVNLGKVGVVTLPVTVAFATAHGTYLSTTPPHGGSISLKQHPFESEEWDLQKDGDKFYLQSWYGTYLSSNWESEKGYKLTKLRMHDEAFSVQHIGEGPYLTLQGSNGRYLSANANMQDGVKQADTADAWEVWELQNTPDGHVTLRSTHGTFLGAGRPQTVGNVTHAYEIDDWEIFTLDHLHGKMTVRNRHGTFLAAHASKDDTNRRMMCSNRASSWELWKPWVSNSKGTLCLQSNSGDFLWADEGKPYYDGFGLMDHCLEHELMEVIIIDDKKLRELRDNRALHDPKNKGYIDQLDGIAARK